MGYMELYDKDLLDLVNLGKSINDFDQKNGDYIKVQIFFENSNVPLGALYSNRLLLKFSEADSYYFGEYHFHPENPEMGFCVGKEHTSTSVSNLKPIPIGPSPDEPLNSASNYVDQLEIFKDSADRIYIKPNEIIKLFNPAKNGKFKLRIHFFRNIKSELANFLALNKNNLIENGNFFARLEAMQTGDLDKSVGKNNFVEMENPGLSPNVLNQSGIGGNEYAMEVTGIEPDSHYVFSCWVAWDKDYNGNYQIVNFTDVSSRGGEIGLNKIEKTDRGGSYIDDKDDAIITSIEIDGLDWYRLYSFVRTDSEVNLGTILVHLGKNSGMWRPSTNALGNRYFTDLRFEKINNLSSESKKEYVNKLKLENK